MAYFTETQAQIVCRGKLPAEWAGANFSDFSGVIDTMVDEAWPNIDDDNERLVKALLLVAEIWKESYRDNYTSEMLEEIRLNSADASAAASRYKWLIPTNGEVYF